jgi:valyl-tRNA synthetase
MPFQRRIWQFIAVRTKEALIVSIWPEMKPFNAIADFENTMEIISGVRTIRKDKNIPFKDVLNLWQSIMIMCLLILIQLYLN